MSNGVDLLDNVLKFVTFLVQVRIIVQGFELGSEIQEITVEEYISVFFQMLLLLLVFLKFLVFLVFLWDTFSHLFHCILVDFFGLRWDDGIESDHSAGGDWDIGIIGKI